MVDASGTVQKPPPEWGIKLSKYIFVPQRVIFAFMGFLACLNAYTTRICISMLMPALVIPRNFSEDENNLETVCPVSDSFFEDDEQVTGNYNWDQELQGFIFSSFYIGYVLGHIPGGELSKIYGGKYVLSIGILISGIFSVLSPAAIEHTGYVGLIASRILMGLGQGTMFPALSSLIAQWIPVNERALAVTAIYSGTSFGTVVANITSSFILTSYGWPEVFYTMGMLAILWFFFFNIMCFNDASSHPYIRPSEKEYLTREMGTISRRTDLGATPWKEFFTSKEFYAMIFAQFGHDWLYYTLVTDLPKYLNDVMQIPIKKSSVFASLPFAIKCFTAMLAGYIGDKLLKNNILHITTSRKIMTTIGGFFPCVFLLLASYSGCDENLVITYFCLSLAMTGFYYAGARVSPNDLSPNYSGSLMALTNGFAAFGGFLAPVVVGLLTPNTTLNEWRSVFWLASVILLSSAIFFNIFGSGEVQPWNEPKHQTT